MLTACKQYSPAAGATQGYIAYTQTVGKHYEKYEAKIFDTNYIINVFKKLFSKF